ncbi:MAG: alpha/beta hydrolase, partial [Rubrivivax sp.]|nr:alpha/beta hydrolase [Rubrivivax sp.]
FVLQLMDHLQVQRFIVGGNSLGGEVAWRTAHRAPERVERLILVDALGLPFESSRMPVSWQVLQIPLLGRISESLLPRPLVAQDLVGVYGSPEGVSSELVDRYFELALREGNRRALAQRLAQWEPGADAALIDTLKLPTLILWGGRDRLIPPPVAQEFQRRIAGSQLVMFERLGHVPQEEDPAATVAPVLAFIKGR